MQRRWHLRDLIQKKAQALQIMALEFFDKVDTRTQETLPTITGYGSKAASVRRWPPSPAESAMCDRCQELDEKIERYRTIAWAINDQRTVDKLVEMIAGMEAQKAALHPEQK